MVCADVIIRGTDFEMIARSAWAFLQNYGFKETVSTYICSTTSSLSMSYSIAYFLRPAPSKQHDVLLGTTQQHSAMN